MMSSEKLTSYSSLSLSSVLCELQLFLEVSPARIFSLLVTIQHDFMYLRFNSASNYACSSLILYATSLMASPLHLILSMFL